MFTQSNSMAPQQQNQNQNQVQPHTQKQCACPCSCTQTHVSTPSLPSRPQSPQQDDAVQSKPIPSFLEEFRQHPRTTNLRHVLNTNTHVAILVKRGKIISHATNRIGSRSRGAGYSAATIHAERNCVKQLGDITQLRGADMYIMRVSRHATNPEFMGSKPCHECEVFLEKCMREYGLKNVYYTA